MAKPNKKTLNDESMENIAGGVMCGRDGKGRAPHPHIDIDPRVNDWEGKDAEGNKVTHKSGENNI